MARRRKNMLETQDEEIKFRKPCNAQSLHPTAIPPTLLVQTIRKAASQKEFKSNSC